MGPGTRGEGPLMFESAARVLRHSAWICWKDLLEFGRSRLRLAMLVLMPLFMMLMVGFIFPSGTSITHQPVALADLDSGANTTVRGVPVHLDLGPVFLSTLGQLNNRTGLLDVSSAASLATIKTQIEDGRIVGGIVVGPDFTQSLVDQRQANVTIITDQSNPQTSSIMQEALTQTIQAMGTEWAEAGLNATYHVSLNVTLAMVQPFRVQTTGIIPGNPNYFEFVAPGITAMVVMMSLMTGLPHAISYERDVGTLDGMLVAPTSRLSIILGKVFAQVTRGMIQAGIIFVLAVGLFGVVVYGSVPLVVGLLLLTVFSFVGLGILITSFADREETANMVMMTLMFPMMFLSGVFFPISQMPWYMQDIASVLPLTYATTALRKVMVLGAGLDVVWTDVAILLLVGIVLLAISVPLFRKAMSR
jgi:ABC-2 type transport system permease protein